MSNKKITRENVEDILPLTPMQEGILFHYLQHDDNRQYHIQFTFTISNHLIDLKRIKKAWQMVIEANEMLRTVFRWENLKKPVQMILKDWEVPIKEYDLTDITDLQQKQKRLSEIIKRDQEEKMDINTAPFRINLCKLEEDRCEIIMSYHHILYDGWSNGIILKEFMVAYQALCEGNNPEKEIKPKFKQYIQWLLKQNEEEQEKYWGEYLKGFDVKTPLPVDRIKQQEIQKAYKHQFELSKEFSSVIMQFTKKHKITLATLFYGVWGLLLQKYSNQDDVVFGTTISGRPPELAGVEQMVGLFINTLPLRVQSKSREKIIDYLERIKKDLQHRANFEYAHLVNIKKVSELKNSFDQLFDSIVVIENYPLDKRLKEKVGDIQIDSYSISEMTNFDITLEIILLDNIKINLIYNVDIFEKATIERLMLHFRNILDYVVQHPEADLLQIEMLSADEIHEQLVLFNNTEYHYPHEKTIHQLFEEQVERTPNDVAVVYQDMRLTYRELNEQANQLAHVLRKAYHLKPDDLVGIHVDRTEQMMIALLAILKAGAAYVPIDPTYPEERKRYIVENSKMKVLLTEKKYTEEFRSFPMEVFVVDSEEGLHVTGETLDNPKQVNQPNDLAYVIYTSGSTGRPKGVMVSHSNVVNFFFAMDQCIEPNSDDALLAVTTYSFDISVLELLWTLTRGIQVVLHPNDQGQFDHYDRYLQSKKQPKMDFSLFFFSNYDVKQKEDRYKLLIDAVKFADQHDFKAVWTPERHFHEFGGLYPNPSVVSAGLAMVTEKIQLRSGSVVSPLHDSIRIAEEWAVVDNLSNGRVGLAFASGWHADDFVLKPDKYEDRVEHMIKQIGEVKRLWKGDSLSRKNGVGKEVELRTYPRPIQEDLPIWITTAGNKETFIQAGKMGAHVLTHLLGQDLDLLAENIRIYRQTLKENGFNPTEGKVSLMLHTFVGEDLDTVRELVKEPFCHYLRSSAGLVRNLAASIGRNMEDVDVGSEELLEAVFEKYWKKAALFGTPETCLAMIQQLQEIGVDEVACLIDFGLAPELVLEGLEHLAKVQDQFIKQNQVQIDKPITMLQSTPSRLKLLVDDNQSRSFLASLKTLLVGGEAFSVELAEELRRRTNARILNMYGPTETTIWSSCYDWSAHGGEMFIGTPIANTEIYVLDRNLHLLPKGVPGEIYIGGAGVARGYFQRDDLTHHRFIHHPFKKGKQLYRTGDIGRISSDGKLVYLGRADDQVKIRGYRIELGEIESILKSHEDVAQAVVVDQKDPRGEKHLIAFIVWKHQKNENEIRDYLSRYLPHYMIPSVFISVETLPLTPNGKIDRKSLVNRDDLFTNQKEETQIRTPIEKQIIQIWKDVLGKDEIGVHQSFFHIGGNSILLMQVYNQLEKLYPGKLKIADLFAYPTISTLAKYIRKKDGIPNSLQTALKMIRFPEDYMSGMVGSKQITMLKFGLPNVYQEKLENVLQLLHRDHYDVLLAAYVYVLGELSDQEQVAIQTWDNEGNQMKSVLIDFSKIENVLELIDEVKYQRTNGVPYSVQDLDNIKLEKEKTMILPLMYQKGWIPQQANLSQFFDLNLEVEKTNGIRFTLAFDSVRMKQAQMKEFIRFYLKVIQQIVLELESISLKNAVR